MLSEAWPLWQVIPLALVLAAPFIVHFVAVPADDPAAARLLARSA